ncbi:MAG: substrate-binding periplasmic protein [Burkholderiales bacterium]
MRSRWPYWGTVIAGLLCGLAAPAHALTALTEANPPFNFMEKGKLTGISVDLVTEMGKRAGVPITVQLVPWNKGYNDVQAKRDTCLFSTARLSNRERLFKWVGPLATNQWALFAKQGFTGKIDKLDDARPYRIGGIEQDARVEWLKERGLTNIVTVVKRTEVPQLLTLDRKKLGGVDLWISGLYAARSIAAEAKVKDVVLVKVVKDEDLYLACNPGVPTATIASLQTALDSMAKDGTQKKIVESYLERFKP